MGAGTGAAVRAVRESIPFLAAGRTVPDVEPLVERIAAGAFDPAALLARPDGRTPGR